MFVFIENKQMRIKDTGRNASAWQEAGQSSRYPTENTLNFLKSGSAKTSTGAAATICFSYSLFETTKANNLEPFQCLRCLLEEIPFITSDDDYRKLLSKHLSLGDLTLEMIPTEVFL